MLRARREKLVVDRGGMKEKKVWSMSQFRRMFNSCKTPGKHTDQLNFHFKTGSHPSAIFCVHYIQDDTAFLSLFKGYTHFSKKNRPKPILGSCWWIVRSGSGSYGGLIWRVVVWLLCSVGGRCWRHGGGAVQGPAVCHARHWRLWPRAGCTRATGAPASHCRHLQRWQLHDICLFAFYRHTHTGARNLSSVTRMCVVKV